MTNEVKIEHYLLELDQALYGLPVSQRAEIITEIKSHIRDSMEKDPAANVDQVLNKLGPAKTVADRYYTMKGIPTPRKSSPMRRLLKAMVITAAVLFGLIFFSGVATIWYFSPLIKIDDAGHRVSFLGGTIDINDMKGVVKVGSLEITDDGIRSFPFNGESDLAGSHVKTVRIPFNTAKLDVDSSADRALKWKCKAASGAGNTDVAVKGDVMTLDLDKLNLAKCAISLPVGIAAEFVGSNGKMDIQAANQNLDIKMSNGKINIHPDHSRVYDFDVQVKNGVRDSSFPHSQAKDAVKIKINLDNGIVKAE